MKLRSRRFLGGTALAAVLTGVGTSSNAAFFQLAENSASGLGNAFAGGAAIAEDASTVWYNPAGMTRLSGSQFVAAGHFINPSFKASVNSATAITGSPISGGGGDAGESAVVPNLYYTRPLSSELSMGLGINAPFGLATEYDSNWAGRYHAIRSEIRSVNVNVAGAYKLSDTLSAGAGLNYQRLDAELTQAIDFATICTIAGAPSGACGATAPGAIGGPFNPFNNPLDGTAKVTADSNAWGYNLGILAQLQNDTRFGATYRSKIKHSLSGDFERTLPTTGNATVDGTVGAVATGLGIVNSGLKADVTLPATLSVSVYQQVSSDWALMADFTRTYWSVLPELRIKFDSNQLDSVVTLNLKNVNRYSVGATYKPGGAWVLRGGIALDESPITSSADNTPRLPDANRVWYAVGAGLQASTNLSLDFGFVYLKADDPRVRKTAAATNENLSRGNLSVDYVGTVQVLSAQARWAF